MKKKLFTLLTLLVCLCSGAWGDPVTLTVSNTSEVSETFADGSVLYSMKSDGTVNTSTKFAGNTKIKNDGTTGACLNDSRFVIKFPKDVSSVTIKGYNGSNRYLTKVSVSNEMTKNTYTDITSDSESNSDSSNPQRYDCVFTISWDSPIVAGKYIWFQFSNAVAFYEIVYTEAPKLCSITLDDNGEYNGNGAGSIRVGQKQITITTAPTRTDYSVDGYYKEAELTNRIADAYGNLVKSTDYANASGEWTATENKTLYAKWITTPKYDVTYNNGGYGTAPDDEDDVESVTLSTLGADFHTNTGWTANQTVIVDGNSVAAGTAIACGKTAYLSVNTTFTAQWEDCDFPYVEGVTFPATPSSTLDMRTQTAYTPKSSGYVVENAITFKDEDFWTNRVNSGFQNLGWTAPSGSVFTSQSSSKVSSVSPRKGTDNNMRTFAMKFTGTTEFMALMNSRSNSSEAHALLVDITSTKTRVGDNNIGNKGSDDYPTVDYVTFTGLNATHTYIAYFYATNDNNNALYQIALKIPSSVSKTISSAGWATYCSPFPLDFTSSIANLTKAYLVTGNTGASLTLSPITGTIPANTGILLEGKGDVTIPVVASSTTNVDANKLEGKTAEYALAAGGGYVLMASPKVGFYKNANAFTVGANTAYLPVGFGDGYSRSFFSFDEEETTGIEGIANSQKLTANGEFFDLQGRRVAQPTKGLYIVNGKKVVIK